MVPNADGTIAFKDAADGKYFTVKDNKITKTNSTTEVEAAGKFIVHSVINPKKPTNVKVSTVDDTALTVSWTGVSDTLYSGYKVVATPSVASSKATIESKETIETSVRLIGLEVGTEYTITVKTVNGDSAFATSDAVVAQTKNGPRPVQVTGIKVGQAGNDVKVSWNEVATATSYDVYKAPIAFGIYTKVDTVSAIN